MKEIYRNIKSFIQRGSRGWSDEDTWGLDEYLSKVISETTKHLADSLHSHPSRLTEKKWEKILNKISTDIKAVEDFELRFEDYFQDQKKNYFKDYITAQKKQYKAIMLLADYFNDLWD